MTEPRSPQAAGSGVALRLLAAVAALLCGLGAVLAVVLLAQQVL